jgi:hypothetical protein
MKNRLKPMGIGAILDNTFSILRERFWAFQGVNFLSFLPVIIFSLILAGIVLVMLGSHSFDFNNLQELDRIFSRSAISILFIFLLMILLFIALITGLIYMMYGNIKLFKCSLHNEPCPFKEVFKGIKGKRWGFIGLMILLFLIMAPLLIVYAILLFSNQLLALLVYYADLFGVMFFFCLAPVVFFLENKGPAQALGRAFTLTAKHRWRIFGTILLVYLLEIILVLVFYSLLIGAIGLAAGLHNVFGYIPAGLLAVLGILAYNIIMSFGYGPLVGIYYDLLIRKEGYDIQRQLAEETNPASATAPDRGLSV